jgi:hypothetical protein
MHIPVCTCGSVQTRKYTQAHIHTCTLTYTITHKRICPCMCMHTHKHIHLHTHTHMHMHTCIHTTISLAHTYTCTHTYAHKLVHECTHAHLHAFTHIHTFTPAAPQSQTRLPPQQNGRSPANPQLSSAMELQASLASSAKRGRPSDFAPIAGASLSRLLEGQPVKKVGSRSLLGKK